MAVPLPSPCLRGYDGGMDERSRNKHLIASAAGVLFFLSFVLLLIGLAVGAPADVILFEIAPIAGLIAFAGSILVATRWVNHRDGSRHAKRPPDPP